MNLLPLAMADSRFIFESETLETSKKFPSSLQLASLESSRKYPSSLQLSRKKGLSLSRVSLDSTLSDASTNELTSALRAQQDEMQKKAFTRWCNFHLVGKDKIQDLYLDFRDGVLLIKFLRCLSGKEFAKPEKGKMRIHAMQNLQACVKFLIKNDVFLDKVGCLSLFLLLLWLRKYYLNIHWQWIEFQVRIDWNLSLPKKQMFVKPYAIEN